MKDDLTARINRFIRFIFLEYSHIILCLLIIAIAGALVYRNALNGPFIFDDLSQILQNPNIRSWQWPWAFIENNRRPALYLTLAWNIHSYGFNAYIFHEFNIRVHILAAIILFFLVRKTLSLPSIKNNLRQKKDLLALASAVLWLVHPMHTQAVTYIIQRAESLMGLFFFAALFFSSQYLTSKKWFWLMAAGLASLLSGLTKEVALVLPFMVMFYDRTFISSDFRGAWKNHRLLYVTLSVTWVVMIVLYLTTRPENVLTAGFGMKGMSPLLYFINQPAVILRYVRLALWPNSLIFDYEWPPVSQVRYLWPSMVIVLSWIIVAMAAYRRYRITSFLLLSFIIILLPSSSIIPLKDLIFEYRVYLSLSCLSIGLVLGLYYFAERFVHSRSQTVFLIACVSVLAVILGGLSYQRNKIYMSEEFVWLDVINKQPTNARAYNNLGEYLMRQNRDSQAKLCFLKAATLNANYPDVYANLSTVFGKENNPQIALEYAKKAIAMTPDFAIAHNNAGSALAQMSRYDEAVPYFQKAIDLGFVEEGVIQNLAVALANSGQSLKAVKLLKEAVANNFRSQVMLELIDKIQSNLPKPAVR